MRQIKNIIWSILDRLGLGGHVLLQIDSALKQNGWFRSYRTKQSVAADGTPIPWYTYPFIAFLRERIRPDWAVFEYGSGNSTQWYAARVSSILAVEHDEEWFKIVKPRLEGNASIIFRERGERYIRSIAETQKKYHIVVVDGRDRVACALASVDSLTEDGVIILDNSDRKTYQVAKDSLKAQGFKRLDFVGMTPIVALETTTSVFYRNNNCMEI
jgi:hypothetical protein